MDVEYGGFKSRGGAISLSSFEVAQVSWFADSLGLPLVSIQTSNSTFIAKDRSVARVYPVIVESVLVLSCSSMKQRKASIESRGFRTLQHTSTPATGHGWPPPDPNSQTRI